MQQEGRVRKAHAIALGKGEAGEGEGAKKDFARPCVVACKLDSPALIILFLCHV